MPWIGRGRENRWVTGNQRSKYVKSYDIFFLHTLLIFAIIFIVYHMDNQPLHQLFQSIIQFSIKKVIKDILLLNEKIGLMSFQNFSESDDFGSDWQQQQYPQQPIQDLSWYYSQLQSIQPSINLQNINNSVLSHHRIQITLNTPIERDIKFYDKDCYITIKKKIHYGTHYIYDVVLANFTLEIHLLNLQRSSHDRQSSDREQIGSGGFGSVCSVKTERNHFAVKRIEFIRKMEEVDGFDIETESAECNQIHKAIREYCLYKICSMLKIGPEVIFRSNYDLVCYTNCIEFIMEYCYTTSKDPAMMLLASEKAETDLIQNLKALHSLKIVHRDIKPQNILYSQSNQRFIFADFGLTHPVQEQSHQKTLTAFAGTPQYCSFQMSSLLKGTKGQVNLYINDLVGLKKTIIKLKQISQSHSSLSHNAMSINEPIVTSFNSIQSQFSQQADQWNIISSHRSSENIYIKSTNSLDAPLKNSGQINFYQSMILFQIFRKIQGQSHDQLQLLIDDTLKFYEKEISQFLMEEVKRYILAIFHPSVDSNQLTLKIIELKNIARNYGPKSQQTLEKIDEIINMGDCESSEEVYNYFSQLKKIILSNPQKLQLSKLSKQIGIHLKLKNNNYLIGCIIRAMRQAAIYLNRVSIQKRRQYNLTFLCKIYLICNRLNAMSISEGRTLNELFLKIWQQSQIQDVLQLIQKQSQRHNYKHLYTFSQNPISHRVTARMIRLALDYILTSSTSSHYDVLQAFTYYISKFEWTDSQDYNYYLEYIDKLEHIKEDDLDKKYNIIVERVKVYRKICKIKDHKQLDKNSMINKVQKIVQQLRNITDLKYYFTSKIQLILIYSQNNDPRCIELSYQFLEQFSLFQCPLIQKRNCLIQINKTLGDSLILNKKYDEGLKYLRQAQNQIVRQYGKQNLPLCFYDCSNNIALAVYKNGDLKQALILYQQLCQYLQYSKKIISFEKSLLYRAIITIRLQLDAGPQDYPLIQDLSKKIVYQTIFAVISLTTSDFQMQSYDFGDQIFIFYKAAKNPQIKVIIMRTLIYHLEEHLELFQGVYYKLNYQLNKVYILQLKQPIKGLRFIWNYIKCKLCNLSRITQQDFKLMNDFSSNLLRSNSARRALILVKSYIFKIPLKYQQQRQSAYKLMHRLNTLLGNPMQKITHEFIVNDCEALRYRNFQRIYNKIDGNGSMFRSMILKKWLIRV